MSSTCACRAKIIKPLDFGARILDERRQWNSRWSSDFRRARRSGRMGHMRLLILGGTAFLGRAVARAALDSGHHVTCAARGVTGQPPEGAYPVRIDRSAPD